jgi:hypothetical protein
MIGSSEIYTMTLYRLYANHRLVSHVTKAQRNDPEIEWTAPILQERRLRTLCLCTPGSNTQAYTFAQFSLLRRALRFPRASLSF